MKKLMLGLIAFAVLNSSAFATMGFLKGEKISGMNKICYYDVLGSIYTLNVSSIELCPLTAEF